MQYLGVSTGNMEEGSFRCDANISIRPVGTTEYLGKVEVKNMNSFRAVYRALEYEAKRQREVSRIRRQDRPGDARLGGRQGESRSASAARNMPTTTATSQSPTCPPLAFSRKMVDDLKAALPELPETRFDRFIEQVRLTPYDAGLAHRYQVPGRLF